MYGWLHANLVCWWLLRNGRRRRRSRWSLWERKRQNYLLFQTNNAIFLTTTYSQSPSTYSMQIDHYSSVHVQYRISKEYPNNQGDTISYSGRKLHNSTHRRACRVRCRGSRRRSRTGAALDGLYIVHTYIQHQRRSVWRYSMTVIEDSSTITLLLPSLQQKVLPVAEWNRGRIHTIIRKIVTKITRFQ